MARYRTQVHYIYPGYAIIPHVLIHAIARKQSAHACARISANPRSYTAFSLCNCLESTECFKPSTLDNIFNDFISKLANTRIQEFLDCVKATTAIKKGTASVSGQNLRDTLLTHQLIQKAK